MQQNRKQKVEQKHHLNHLDTFYELPWKWYVIDTYNNGVIEAKYVQIQFCYIKTGLDKRLAACFMIHGDSM